MAKVKYFQFYESLYKVTRDLPSDEFKRALCPLLDYAFTDSDHVPDEDRFFESIFIQNVVFIEKLQQDMENGKKGGRPGAPKGNKDAKKKRQKTPLKPDKDTETDTETDTDTETATDTATDTEKEKEKAASFPEELDAPRSEPEEEYKDASTLKGRSR